MTVDVTRKRRPTTILRKVVVMTCLMAALSVVVFAVFMTGHYRRVAAKEVEASAQNAAQVVRAGCARILADRDYTAVVEFCLGWLRNHSDVAYVSVETPDGFVLVHTTRGWRKTWYAPSVVAGREPEQRRSLWERISTPDGGYVYREPISHAGETIGWVEVEMSLAGDVRQRLEAFAMTGRVGGISLFLSAILSFFYARNLTRPMRELQSYAQRVAAGAHSARVEIRSDDEIGDLAESITTMVQSMDVSRLHLQDSLQNKAALREKEILLREIHHRVKNNMQILTSLLRLQTRQADTPELRGILQESEARIRSMGLLHEKLYQSENVSLINMRSYLDTLTNELTRMTPGRVKPEIRVVAPSVHLGLDTALPCGLMVTELVSNSLKYAFDGNPSPTVVVSLLNIAEGTFQLVVWDNGSGFENANDFTQSKSLGLRLVRMLTHQLNGTLHISGTQGTKVVVEFKETIYKKRL
ncbi:hypothetical protein BH23VER1_BH23VER1_10330 [soil metagenome]